MKQRMRSTIATPHPALFVLWGLALLAGLQPSFEWTAVARELIGSIALVWGAIGYFLRWASYSRCLLWRQWLLLSFWFVVIWVGHCFAAGDYGLGAIALFVASGFFNRNSRDTQQRNAALAAHSLSRVLD